MMKNYFLGILVAVVSIGAFGQDELELHYKLKAIALKKSYKKVAKQLNGGNMDFYFTKDNYRFDVGFKRSKVNTITIINSEKDSVAMFQEAPEMGKIAYVYSFSDHQEDKEMAEKENSKKKKSKFTKTSETRVIKGYTCEKSYSEENGNRTEIWTTNNLKNPNSSKSIVDGTTDVPVQFSVLKKGKGILLTYTLKKVKTEIDNERKSKVFNLTVPKGFLIKDYEDLQRFLKSNK